MSFIGLFLIAVLLFIIFRDKRAVLSLLILLGIACLYIVVHDFVSEPSLEELQAQRESMKEWPTVEGVLEEITLKKDLPHSKGAYWYRAKVKYRYSVEREDFVGDDLGIQDYQSSSAEELEERMRRFFSQSNIFDRKVSEDTTLFSTREIRLSFINQPVKVFYDPDNHASSILDPVDRDPLTTWDVYSFRLAFLLLGVVLIVIPTFRWTEVYKKTKVSLSKFPEPSAESKTPSNWYEWLESARLLLSQDRYREALHALDKSIEDNPCEAGTWPYETQAQLMKCECFIALGSRAEAMTRFQQAQSELRGHDIPWIISDVQRIEKLLEKPNFIESSFPLDEIMRAYLGGDENSPRFIIDGGSNRLRQSFPKEAVEVERRCQEVLQQVEDIGNQYSHESSEKIAEEIYCGMSARFPELSTMTKRKLENWFIYKWK